MRSSTTGKTDAMQCVKVGYKASVSEIGGTCSESLSHFPGSEVLVAACFKDSEARGVQPIRVIKDGGRRLEGLFVACGDPMFG